MEVGVLPEQADREDLVRHLQPTVLSWLEKLGWITASDIVCVVTHILRYAYVHHTQEVGTRSSVARSDD